MSFIEAMKTRKSVRSFTGETLSASHLDALQAYISSLTAPFGTKARIELINLDLGGKPVKLGTYGIISGAAAFLVLLYEDGALAEQGAGYMFEQAVLGATRLGLGTCWLGGTLNKKDFAANIDMKPDELLRIVSPVGYPAKRRFIEKVMRSGAGSDSRKPFGSLFFESGFDTPLEEDKAGRYREPLNMVRLAPSASNTQPWRVVLKDGVPHFYYREASRFSGIDMGIALCHFEQACVGLGIKGRYEVLDRAGIPETEKEKYTISWISE